MSGPALVVDDLSVTYPGGHQGLSRVGFQVARGESLGVVGASGSGKTTLLRAILGLLPHGSVVSGRLEVDGHDLLALKEPALRSLRGRTIGYVAQDPFAACDPLRRVRHHVSEAWTAHGSSPRADEIDTGFERVGIADPSWRSRQYPHQWSGGMLQRATTLAATVHDPVLTLADEPTSALDTELADGALDLLRSTCSALVLVTHDLALASRHTDHVVVFDAGTIVERGRSRSVLMNPTVTVTKQLVAAAAPAPRQSSQRVRGSGVVVQAESISKRYAPGRGTDIVAVAPTSLDLHAGQVVGIVGPSGSGKSTLLRLLAGMERPDSGNLVVEGRTVWGSSSTPRSSTPRMPRKGFVMPVFQDPVGSLDPRWPLWRTITEPIVLTRGRLTRADRRERAAEQLAHVGLHDIDVDRLPGSLSVGQCQRVAIVRALIAGPGLIAADEPTASLDVQAAEGVSDLLRLAADKGAAVVVVSHDEVRLRSYADRILRMRQGALVDES